MSSLKLFPLIPLIFLLACGCQGQDDRLLRQIERQSELQAEQSLRLADMQTDVASGSRRLVEHDASARAAWTTLNQKLEEAREDLDRRRDELHSEQQAFARSQVVAPLVAGAILQIGRTIICLLPLAVFVWFVLRTRHAPSDELLAETLLEDWLDRQPISPAPKLISTTLKGRSDSQVSA